jgi:hypothetical protein
MMRINASCPSCSFVFQKEQGYFTGAMALSYVLGFVAILPPFLYLLFTEADFFTLIAVPSAVLICFAPLSFRFSRLIWIGIDHASENKNGT